MYRTSVGLNVGTFGEIGTLMVGGMMLTEGPSVGISVGSDEGSFRGTGLIVGTSVGSFGKKLGAKKTLVGWPVGASGGTIIPK